MKQYFDEMKEIVTKRLIEISEGFQYSNILKVAMQYTLLNPGKLFRPSLLLATLSDLNHNVLDGIDIACAIEMIHAYGLIHDDLPALDNAHYRRGKVVNHAIYGEAQAILAGDALLTEAFQVVANSKLEPSQIVSLVQLISKNAGANGMVGGQSLDILSEHEDRDDLSVEMLDKIHLGKTGALIEAAMLSAGIVAKANASVLEDIRQIAYHIGLAFQIKDDISDLMLTSQDLGKDVKNDLAKDKTTYPKLFGLEKSKAMLIDNATKAINLIDKHFGTQSKLYYFVEEGLK
jgi:geranylgeranyl diphosphate synthase, type II